MRKLLRGGRKHKFKFERMSVVTYDLTEDDVCLNVCGGFLMIISCDIRCYFCGILELTAPSGVRQTEIREL